MIKNVDEKNFEEEVLKFDGKVLADFNADWCGPCKMIRPILDEIASERSEVKIVSINVDDNSELARKYGVMSIPCLVLLENGKEINRSVGFISKDKIEDFMRGE